MDASELLVVKEKELKDLQNVRKLSEDLVKYLQEVDKKMDELDKESGSIEKVFGTWEEVFQIAGATATAPKLVQVDASMVSASGH